MRKLLLCMALISLCACAACQQEAPVEPGVSPDAVQTETGGTEAPEKVDKEEPEQTPYDVQGFLRGENKELIEELQNAGE